MEVDELDVNPFYRQLQSTHFRLFEKAQNDCCVICVPQKRSLKSDNFSMKFIETHILKSSPYFAGQYVTTNTSKSKTVSLDGAVLRTGDGFEKEITVKILSEEIGYNKEYKPFRILVIEKPLDPHYQTLPGSQSKLDDFLTVKGGFDECKAFLTSYPAYNEAVSSLDSRILKFNTNYMVLPDYLDDAAKRLQNLCSHTIEKCLEETNQKDLNEPQFSDVLNVSVQGFTLRKVHQKVYSAVCERFGSVDGQLLEKCERLKAVGGDQLGVPDVFLCPLPSAVVELANLDNFKTPFEKLKCIKSTLDRIAESVNTHVLENRHPSMSSDDTPCLTTDDLIPILVTVISQARCPHLHSNVFYMENFFWPTSSKNDISYSLVTLKAAVEYIRTTDFSSLLLSKISHKKELSLDELRDATDKIRLSEGGGNSSQSGSQGAPLSRIDRQLMRISKMLDKSFSDAEKSRKQAATTSIFDPDPPPEVARGRGADVRPVQGTRKEKQNRTLNAPFNDDLFMTSFGKQT